MSDLLFIKQLSNKWWLGLRQPNHMTLAYNDDGTASVSTGWRYDEATALPVGFERLWVPMLKKGASDAEMPFEWFEVSLPETRAPGLPFGAFLDKFKDEKEALKRLLDSETNDDLGKRFTDQINTLQTTPRPLLRALSAYRELEPTELGRLVKDDDTEPGLDLLTALHRAMGGQANSINIDLFSGLLFVVATGKGVPQTAASAGVFVDSSPTEFKPPLTLTARQGVDRVLLRPLVDGAMLTNSSILTHCEPMQSGDAALPAYSPYYRLHRGLGVDGRAAWRSGLIVIPTKAPEGRPDAPNLPEPRPQEKPWAERPFQVVNPVAPELTGELLNYRLELFNFHGRRLHTGRVLVLRQNMNPPAAPVRGSARLAVPLKTDGSPDGTKVTLQIRMDLAPAEHAALQGGDTTLKPVVYAQTTSRIPTGFYGDSDDAALAVGRLLSDMDPGAVLASGAASIELTAGERELASTRLSAQGLMEVKTQATLKPPAVAAKSTSQNKAADAVDIDDAMAWELTLPLKDYERYLEKEKCLRLFLALRRELGEESFVVQQRDLQSAVIPVDMSIVDGNGTVINVVPHFEDFWTPAPALPPAEEDHARVFCVRPADPGQLPAGVLGSLRVEIDHAKVASKAPNVGGYRLWVRETAGMQSPWAAVSVVQVVPPLVKAYAPVETGRIWGLESGNENGIPANTGIPANAGGRPPSVFRADGKVDAETQDIDPESYSSVVVDTGTALLALVKKLTSKGFAAEYILSVAQRRRLERLGIRYLEDPSGAPAAQQPPADGLPEGNWLLLKDQNGHYLGRAWRFWGRAVTDLTLKKRYTLVEVPNTQDTVATDDFGKATWTWHGLTDKWGHDFEWVVEPLSRQAPLLQRLAAQRIATEKATAAPTQDGAAPDEASDAAPQSGDRYRRTASDALTERLVPLKSHFVHTLRVQRTAPLTGRFGVVQSITDQDAFVFRVSAPDEFREASFNSVARSAFGVHKIRVLKATRSFIYKIGENEVFKVDSPYGQWVGETNAPEGRDTGLSLLAYGEKKGEGKDAPDSNDLPFYGELVIDEPPCVAIDLTLQPVADGVAAEEKTELVRARRQVKAFRSDLTKESTPTVDGKTLRVPLARLSWTYAGPSDPPLSLLVGVPEYVKNRRLLELPDPDVQVEVYRKQGESALLVAKFIGPGLQPDDGAWPTGFVNVTSSWGKCQARDGQLPVAEPPTSGVLQASPGELTLAFADEFTLSDIVIVWRHDAVQLVYPPAGGKP